MSSSTRFMAVALAVAGVLSLPPTAVAEGESGAGNGYVLMVHGWFEPYPEGQPHAAGVVMAVRDGDHVTFSAIPYSVATGRPVVVRHPRLEVVDPETKAVLHTLEPNVDSNNPPCRRETSFEGHEGPVQACPTFRAPVSDFGGRHVVGFIFRFSDDGGGPHMEPYSVVNHTLLHGYLQAGAPEDLSAADRAGGPDPFLIASDVDPVP
jgi:hypothetical protein